MTRVTPLRLTTLQCSQIGFTLVRTFTKNLEDRVGQKTSISWTDSNSKKGSYLRQVRQHIRHGVPWRFRTGYGPTQHHIAGARVRRLARCHDPGLILRGCPRKPYPG